MDVLARFHLPDLNRLPGRRTRLIRRWLAAGLLLAGALLFAYPGSARGAPTTPTVVAAHDLPSGAALRAADVRLADLPDSARPAGAVSTLDGVGGRLLAGAVRAGEPLTDVRLASTVPGAGDPATATVPVRLADAGVAELLGRAGASTSWPRRSRACPRRCWPAARRWWSVGTPGGVRGEGTAGAAAAPGGDRDEGGGDFTGPSGNGYSPLAHPSSPS